MWGTDPATSKYLCIFHFIQYMCTVYQLPLAFTQLLACCPPSFVFELRSQASPDEVSWLLACLTLYRPALCCPFRFECRSRHLLHEPLVQACVSQSSGARLASSFPLGRPGSRLTAAIVLPPWLSPTRNDVQGLRFSRDCLRLAPPRNLTRILASAI